MPTCHNSWPLESGDLLHIALNIGATGNDTITVMLMTIIMRPTEKYVILLLFVCP